jgi:hypothetical protein
MIKRRSGSIVNKLFNFFHMSSSSYVIILFSAALVAVIDIAPPKVRGIVNLVAM